MALAITATYNSDTDSPGVDLVITDADGYDTLTVERVDNTGAYETTPVRGLDGISPSLSTIAETDFEAPIGISVKYRAIGYDFNPGIILTGTGTRSAGTTTANPAFAAGSVAGDLHLMSVVMKPYTATLATPSGWTLVASKTSGTTASGVDTGSVVEYVFSREGALSGTVALAPTGSNTIDSVINTFQKSVSNAWSLSAVSGSDESAGAGHSSTATSTLSPQAGDVIYASVGYNTDNNDTSGDPTMTLTMPNSMLSTPSEINTLGNSLGDDCGLDIFYSVVSSSTGAGAPTFTRTVAVNALFGSSIFVRVSVTSSVSETVESNNVTIPYTLTGDAWLKSVFTPALSKAVHVNEFSATNFETQILGNYNVLGRVFPVIITDAWGARRGTFKLLSGHTDFTDFKDLKDLITTGGQLLFQTTGDLVRHQPDMYIEVEKYSAELEETVKSSIQPIYIHTIDFIEIEQPNTSDEGFGLRSYQDVLDDFDTYTAVLAAYPTYLDMLTG